MDAKKRDWLLKAARITAAIDIATETGELPDKEKFEFSDEMLLEYQKTGKIPADWSPAYSVGLNRRDLNIERQRTTYLFENIRNEAKYFWKELEKAKADMDSHIEEYAVRHNEKAIAEERARLNTEYIEKASSYAQSLREYAKQACEAKRKAIDGAISKAPTNEQLNILKSLEMEGSEITEEEITAILPTLFENYRAMKTLSAIARKNHISLYIPDQYDSEKLNENLAFVSQYINDRADDLLEFAKSGKWPFYHDGEEFFFKDYEWKIFDDAAAVLDGNAQIQNSKVYVKPRKLTNTELKIVEEIASCDPRELKETLNKAAESPEIRRLILLHPEYAPLLEPRKSSEEEE